MDVFCGREMVATEVNVKGMGGVAGDAGKIMPGGGGINASNLPIQQAAIAAADAVLKALRLQIRPQVFVQGGGDFWAVGHGFFLMNAVAGF